MPVGVLRLINIVAVVVVIICNTLFMKQKAKLVTYVICGWPGEKYTHTHTHSFNGPLSGTTRVSRYQKGKTNLDFTEARDSEWQWNPLGHMQVCSPNR